MLESALKEITPQTQANKQKQSAEQPNSDTMPPTSHTLMDLIITLSIYLPRPTYPTLFSLAALILPQQSDPQLQKKAYKLLPRLASSTTGTLALKDRNAELQTLLIESAASVSAPARRDRLAAIAVVIEHLPNKDLHFIPSLLSEVVLACKEVNEKARIAAFDLLVLMAKKMSAGGTIQQYKILHMDANAPTAQASLEEFFTMVSAGLVGSSPHMISASITALTRVLYEFRSDLSKPVMEDLVQTMSLFLTSTNREIVRSVLGFVKVAIISLPEELVRPRLESLTPGLMSWSHEHKARFRSKVKHILERALRRFGYEVIDRYCPEDDKKLIQNIRKSRERKKKKKDAGIEDGAADGEKKRQGRFESEYDEAIYGSDDSSVASSDEGGVVVNDSDDDGRSSRKGRTNGTYITEADDEPLDLLDRRSLANISSRKPQSVRQPPTKGKRKGKVDIDGKLVFHENDEKDPDEGDDASKRSLYPYHICLPNHKHHPQEATTPARSHTVLGHLHAFHPFQTYHHTPFTIHHSPSNPTPPPKPPTNPLPPQCPSTPPSIPPKPPASTPTSPPSVVATPSSAAEAVASNSPTSARNTISTVNLIITMTWMSTGRVK